MHIVDDPIETIHVYMVPEEGKQAPLLLPLFGALVCLAVIMGVTMYSGSHPAYEHETLTIPARFLPPQTFTATQAIIPTGIKIYPATTAQGTLTIMNGSVIVQILPAGFSTVSTSGVSVVTDEAVFVPVGNANGYGWATVGAHAIAPGASGNIPAVAIDRVEGTSLYIRNLSAFSGGQDSYSVKFVTAQDQQTALLQARGILLGKSTGLHAPCIEDQQVGNKTVAINWHCRFVQPPRLNMPNARITEIKLLGKNLLIDVLFIAQPELYRAK